MLNRALEAGERIEFQRWEYADHSRWLAWDALSILASAAGTIGDRHTMGRIAVILERYPDDHRRARVLARLAVGLTQKEDLEAAVSALEQALMIADRSNDPSTLSKVLESLVEVEGTEAGAIAVISRPNLLEAAEAAAQRTQEEDWGARILATLATAQTQARKFDRALDTARRITHCGYRSVALANIAKGLREAGDQARAEAVLEQSVNTTEEIGKGEWHYDALSSVAAVVAQGQDWNRMDRVLAEAHRIGDASDRARALSGVAAALHQVGRKEQARKNLAKALGDAELDSPYRQETIIAVVQALVVVIEPPDIEASNWVAEAFSVAGSHGRDDTIRHLQVFAPILARLGIIGAVWDRLEAVHAVFRAKA
jgi:tetratricopeptide (TPR) repeat protein